MTRSQNASWGNNLLPQGHTRTRRQLVHFIAVHVLSKNDIAGVNFFHTRDSTIFINGTGMEVDQDEFPYIGFDRHGCNFFKGRMRGATGRSCSVGPSRPVRHTLIQDAAGIHNKHVTFSGQIDKRLAVRKITGNDNRLSKRVKTPRECFNGMVDLSDAYLQSRDIQLSGRGYILCCWNKIGAGIA